MPFLNLLLLSSGYLLLPLQTSLAQSISTSTPVPPLQWINLTSLLQGPSAPPLKDASIGYDNTTRTLIIFGGESQGGLPQQQTYLSVFLFVPFFWTSLIPFPSVSTLTPSSGPLPHLKLRPLPHHRPQEVPPSGAVISPPASMSFSLLQPFIPLSLSKSRSGHVVIGGKGGDGLPLSDVWVRPSNTLAPITRFNSRLFTGI